MRLHRRGHLRRGGTHRPVRPGRSAQGCLLPATIRLKKRPVGVRPTRTSLSRPDTRRPGRSPFGGAAARSRTRPAAGVADLGAALDRGLPHGRRVRMPRQRYDIPHPHSHDRLATAAAQESALTRKYSCPRRAARSPRWQGCGHPVDPRATARRPGNRAVRRRRPLRQGLSPDCRTVLSGRCAYLLNGRARSKLSPELKLPGLRAGPGPHDLAFSRGSGPEAVGLDASADVDDAGLIFAGGEVAGLPGGSWAGPGRVGRGRRIRGRGS